MGRWRRLTTGLGAATQHRGANGTLSKDRLLASGCWAREFPRCDPHVNGAPPRRRASAWVRRGCGACRAAVDRQHRSGERGRESVVLLRLWSTGSIESTRHPWQWVPKEVRRRESEGCTLRGRICCACALRAFALPENSGLGKALVKSRGGGVGLREALVV